jgi:hypothetical protein
VDAGCHERVAWTPDATNESQEHVKLRLGPTSGKSEILAAAFRVKTSGDRNRLDEGGLAAAILSDEKSHGGIHFE